MNTWTAAHQTDANRLLFSLLTSDPELSTNAACISFVQQHGAGFEATTSDQQKINDYDIVRKIGRGQFGDIELCKHKATGELVAIKIISKAETLRSANPGQALVEREVLACLAEAGAAESVTRLKAAFHDDNFLYLVQEYLPGGDLFTLVDRTEEERLPEAHVKFYLAELVEALNVVHKLGYAHRDVKPENLLIDEAGHLKLADFGSASKLGASHSASTALSTPDYTAPEVLNAIRDGNVTVAAAADLWSVGVVAYELLVGEMPFSAEQESETYMNILNHTKLLEVPEDAAISTEARDLIFQLLAPESTRLDIAGIKAHPFFADVNWETMRSAPEEEVPTVPKLGSKDDTTYFELDDLEGAEPRARLNSDPMVAMGASFAHGVAGLPFVGWTWTATEEQEQEQEQEDVEEGEKEEAAAAAAAAAVEEEEEEAYPTTTVEVEAHKPQMIDIYQQEDNELAAPKQQASRLTNHSSSYPTTTVEVEAHKSQMIDIYKQEDNELAAPKQQASRLTKRRSSRQLRRRRSLVDTTTMSAQGTVIPGWKAAVLAAKRDKVRVEAEAARAEDPKVKYAHLPEWRQRMVLAKLAKANKTDPTPANSTKLQTSG